MTRTQAIICIGIMLVCWLLAAILSAPIPHPVIKLDSFEGDE